ncbi:cbb3-type cytochrome c oxidase subunit 3 [Psychrobacter okhotskensis]|uniref:cbb3-type cytochrome oxidase subunit 3 n=1 Tax=Psychrobacter okhotskensis TaxID=212403 RepID=UPI0015658B81|nr:cbb3-type cytochrome c oxidase subunit 3 [Psychrobacter okhotskensis]NRD70853.1 cbb3-type cytochrome c oxidase subunit 3 [Psychrobacter okhotskensis]
MGLVELQILGTVSAFVAFVALAWWAYSPKNKKRFEEDAQLALDDEEQRTSSEEWRNKDKK